MVVGGKGKGGDFRWGEERVEGGGGHFEGEAARTAVDGTLGGGKEGWRAGQGIGRGAAAGCVVEGRGGQEEVVEGERGGRIVGKAWAGLESAGCAAGGGTEDTAQWRVQEKGEKYGRREECRGSRLIGKKGSNGKDAARRLGKKGEEWQGGQKWLWGLMRGEKGICRLEVGEQVGKVSER